MWYNIDIAMAEKAGERLPPQETEERVAIIIDECAFYELAANLRKADARPVLSQFRRINDTTIVWWNQPDYDSPHADVFIRLYFDDAVPQFTLECYIGGNAIYRSTEPSNAPYGVLSEFRTDLHFGAITSDTYDCEWKKYGL